MTRFKPTIITDGGPWATHDMPCCVYEDEPAVLQIITGVFEPSWKAQREGWELVKVNRFQRWILKRIGLLNQFRPPAVPEQAVEEGGK